MSNFRSILPENRDSSLQDNHGNRSNSGEGNRYSADVRDRRNSRKRSDSYRDEKRPYREEARSTGNAEGNYNRRKPSNYGKKPLKNNVFTKISNKLPVPPVVILFVLIIVPVFIAMFTLAGKLNSVNKELETQKIEKQRLEASIESLKSELEKVNTDEFIERYAHEKLGMVKQNEIVYDVNNKESSSSVSSEKESQSTRTQTEELPEAAPEEHVANEADYNTNNEEPAEGNEEDNAGH